MTTDFASCWTSSSYYYSTKLRTKTTDGDCRNADDEDYDGRKRDSGSFERDFREAENQNVSLLS